MKTNNAVWGIRFILIVNLLLLHLGYKHVINGKFIVTFFFVSSGYFYGIREQNTYTLKSAFQFYRDKYKKNYFTYLFVSVLWIYWLHLINYDLTYLDIILHFLKIKTWIPYNVEHIFVIGQAVWFSSSIMFCYLLVPLISNSIKKSSVKNTLLGRITILLLLFFVDVVVNEKIKNPDLYSIGWWMLYASPFRAIDFLIGFFVGDVFYNEIEKLREKNNYTLWTMVEVIVILLSYYLSNRLPDLGFSCVIPSIMVVIVGTTSKGLIEFILSRKFFIIAGKVSIYSFMIHQTIYLYMDFLFGIDTHYSIENSVYKNIYNGIVSLLIVYAICFVIYGIKYALKNVQKQTKM